MIEEPISIITYRKSFLPILGLKNRYKETFIVDDNLLVYKSKLGKLGEIKSEWIKFIDSYKFAGSDTIRIRINDDYKSELNARMSTFNRKMSELYLKNNGAEIIIFQSESLMPLSDFLDLLKRKLKK